MYGYRLLINYFLVIQFHVFGFQDDGLPWIVNVRVIRHNTGKTRSMMMLVTSYSFFYEVSVMVVSRVTKEIEI